MTIQEYLPTITGSFAERVKYDFPEYFSDDPDKQPLLINICHPADLTTMNNTIKDHKESTLIVILCHVKAITPIRLLAKLHVRKVFYDYMITTTPEKNVNFWGITK